MLFGVTPNDGRKSDDEEIKRSENERLYCMTVFVDSCILRPNRRSVSVDKGERTERYTSPVAVVIGDNRTVVKLPFHLALRKGIDKPYERLRKTPRALYQPIKSVQNYFHFSISLMANSASISPDTGGTKEMLAGICLPFSVNVEVFGSSVE